MNEFFYHYGLLLFMFPQACLAVIFLILGVKKTLDLFVLHKKKSVGTDAAVNALLFIGALGLLSGLVGFGDEMFGKVANIVLWMARDNHFEAEQVFEYIQLPLLPVLVGMLFLTVAYVWWFILRERYRFLTGKR